MRYLVKYKITLFKVIYVFALLAILYNAARRGVGELMTYQFLLTLVLPLIFVAIVIFIDGLFLTIARTGNLIQKSQLVSVNIIQLGISLLLWFLLTNS